MFGYFEQKVGEVWNVLAPVKTDEELLFALIEQGRIDEVNNLMNTKHINPNIKNQAGNSLLHVACYHGNETIVRNLLGAGADINALGARGSTCLHFAAQKGHDHLVQFLIDNGLSVCVRDASGRNAYDVATGFSLKQKLMQLVLAEEQRTGTAPQIMFASRDNKIEAERMKNLPPPPIFDSPGPGTDNTSDPNYRPPAFTGRKIKEDGFVTTVGNPDLAAKYGNVSNFRPAPDTASEQAAPTAPPTYIAPNQNNPFARGRYVHYDAVNNVAQGVATPQAPGTNVKQVVPPAASNQYQIFTPSAAQQGVQPGQFQQGAVQPPAPQGAVQPPQLQQQGAVQPPAPQGAVQPPQLQQHGAVQPPAPQGAVQPPQLQQGAVQPPAPQGAVQPMQFQQGTVQPTAPQGAVQPPPLKAVAPPPSVSIPPTSSPSSTQGRSPVSFAGIKTHGKE